MKQHEYIENVLKDRSQPQKKKKKTKTKKKTKKETKQVKRNTEGMPVDQIRKKGTKYNASVKLALVITYRKFGGIRTIDAAFSVMFT